MVELKDRIADRMTQFIGSWMFIMLQLTVLSLWAILNTVAWCIHWDEYPFVFMNLFMSAEAAFATPIVLMAQGRQSEHDRQTLINDLKTDEESLILIKEIHGKVLGSDLASREELHEGWTGGSSWPSSPCNGGDAFGQ